MPQEKMSGVIASSELDYTSEKGWKTFSVAFENGDTIKALVQPKFDFEFEPGKEVGFFKGKFDKWILDKDLLEGETGGSTPQGKSSGSYSKSNGTKSSQSGGQMDREDYWRGKDNYERNVRDPKIEWQTYFGQVVNVYTACIEHLPEMPSNSKEIDRFIDDMIAKADAIFEARNK